LNDIYFTTNIDNHELDTEITRSRKLSFDSNRRWCPGLSRKIVGPDGLVICQCDGTSMAVRLCLSSHGGDKAINNCRGPEAEKVGRHYEYSQACALDGVARIGEIIEKAMRE